MPGGWPSRGAAELRTRDEVRSAYLGGPAEGCVTTFPQLVVVGISSGSVFALVGIALVLVYRTTGIVNFAQGVFAVMGGLLSYWFRNTCRSGRGSCGARHRAIAR